MGTFNRIQLKRYTYFQQEQYKPVLDADGQPVVNPDTGDAEMTLSEKSEYYFGNYFPIEVEPTNYTKGLYVIDYDKELPGKFKLWRADDHWLDLDGTKQMRGGIKAASGLFYWKDNNFGLHMNNSDIIGAHGIYFNDVVDSDNEGINFIRNNGNYDNIAALDGELYFTINAPKVNNASVGLQHKVLTANNYNTFSPKLDGTGATGNWNINAASAKKLDHNVTINLTDTDNKNGVKGSITTDFSGAIVNIATEISPLDASKITSGIIDIERLPQGVLERLVPVGNKAERLALTKAQVQNGDTVKQLDTLEMWYVSDDNKLNSDAGYEVYTAGRASSVPWTGVEGKPTQLTLTGNVTGSVSLGAGVLSFGTTISPNVVDNTKLADMPVNTIKGRQGSVGDPQDLNSTQIRAMLNVADGANNYVHAILTPRTSGFYKITVNSEGHVSAVDAVTTADIMGLHTAYTSRAAGFYKVTVDNKGHVSAVDVVTKADITALGIPAQDTIYTHPAYTARAAGFYKVTVDALGHLSGVTNVTKADITALGIPAQDTTYSNFTRTATGLVPAPGGSSTNRYMREDGTWAVPPDTNTTYGLATTTTNGLLRQLNGSTSNFLRGDGTWANVPVSPSPDLSNYVTLNGVQTITGKKTFSDGILIDNMGIHNVANAFRLQNMTGGTTSYITLKPDGQSTFDGSIFVAGGGFGSDFRFKDKIREIDTSKASKIKLYQFYNLRANLPSGGVIAQELEKLYPDAVMTDITSDEKYKYVDYNYVFSILHAEHRKEIENLRKEVQEKSMYDLDKLSIRKLFKLILLKILNFE